MIGVVATEAERPWVAEFFELFKTPWEFCRSGSNYDVLLCTTGDIPTHISKLLIVFSSQPLPEDARLNLKTAESNAAQLLQGPEGEVPIYGKCLAFEGGRSLGWQFAGATGGGAVESSLHGMRLVRVGFDLFEEVEHLLTHGQPVQHAAIPTLELHIAMLRRLIVESGMFLVEIPPIPQGYSMTACLTHDMDHPGLRFHGLDHTILGFLKRATVSSLVNFLRNRLSLDQLLRNWIAALKLPLVYSGVARDFWRQTERYIELEGDLASTFFVIPKKHEAGQRVGRQNSQRRASAYEAAEIAEDLRGIVASGREVGVHGLDAWMNASLGREEHELVAAAAGNGCTGVRMHWLCFDKDSPATSEAAGYDYDSTVGYNECVGYRSGTTQVYRPPGAKKLLELPLHLMDTALLYPAYLNLSQQQAAERVQSMVDHVNRIGGVLTVNWHDRSLAPERQWELPYRRLLTMLRERRAWCPPAAKAVRWFRRRRTAEWQSQAGEGGVVKLLLPEPEIALPGMVVHAYNLSDGSGTLKQPAKLPLPTQGAGSVAINRAGLVRA